MTADVPSYVLYLQKQGWGVQMVEHPGTPFAVFYLWHPNGSYGGCFRSPEVLKQATYAGYVPKTEGESR